MLAGIVCFTVLQREHIISVSMKPSIKRTKIPMIPQRAVARMHVMMAAAPIVLLGYDGVPLPQLGHMSPSS